ncbi:carbohydrate ABC transporter permease [Paenibacillus humicola]|uniref:carbohydrate ABC transporter permease n=1 Tax=Paenibacillus humicola TaxID=3110540 RepID=UPI00237A5972|nr:carbohydrate ABC transporter permease [Paenibacillus humicola]
MVQDKRWGSRLFDGINAALLLLVSTVAVIPFLYIIAASFTAREELLQKTFVLFPTKFSLEGYRYIFSNDLIVRSIGVSIYITVLGTLLNLLFTSTMAYALARRDLDGRKPIMLLILFTMLFSGGMIPTYLVIRDMGMLNSLWSLMIPVLISPFNLIVLRSFFQSLPGELEEAAKIDGCKDLGILFKIVLPLSMPAMATFALFYSVTHWNSYFQAVLYINDSKLWPVQVWLRQIVIVAEGGFGDAQYNDTNTAPPAQIVKMAVIVASTLPILVVYPFLQKHFAKGALLGSVKG